MRDHLRVALLLCKFLTMRWMLLLAVLLPGISEGKDSMKEREIRIYMSYTYPIDPASIPTLPDMDLSYGLASTLVDLDEHANPMSGLAAKWQVENEKTITFFLRKNASWSNGKAINSHEVKRSFERAKTLYPTQLRGLFGLVEKIETPTDDSVRFKLNASSQVKGLLIKLTEPMYGVVSLTSNGELDLSVSSGPFFLESGSKLELMLRRNGHWYKNSDKMAEYVTVRQKPMEMRSESVLTDNPWPNIASTSSLLSRELSTKYKPEAYEFWKRNLDRVFLFILGRRQSNDEGFRLIRFLEKNLDRALISQSLTGFTLTNQIYPKGTPLYDNSYTCSSEPSGLPEIFSRRPVEVLMTPERVPPALESVLKVALKKATGVEPRFIKVALNQVMPSIAKGEFDLYAGSVGAEDPNIDGALSYYFDGAGALIPSRSGAHDFTGRLEAARKTGDEKERVQAMRAILRDSVCLGHALPLFHYSTIAIARKNLDLSAVPTTDETVSFSKVRFRK